MSELDRRGEQRRESGAFLLARRGDTSGRITRVVYYDDLDPDCLLGGIAFSGFGFSALWDICVDEGFDLIADVHTHPGNPSRRAPPTASTRCIRARGTSR